MLPVFISVFLAQSRMIIIAGNILQAKQFAYFFATLAAFAVNNAAPWNLLFYDLVNLRINVNTL
jgi:hypothetical protein